MGRKKTTDFSPTWGNELGKFHFYRDTWEKVKDIPAAEKSQLFDAIMEYAFSGTEPRFEGWGLKAVWSSLVYWLHYSCKKCYDCKKAGQEGGAEEGNQHARKYHVDTNATISQNATTSDDIDRKGITVPLVNDVISLQTNMYNQSCDSPENNKGNEESPLTMFESFWSIYNYKESKRKCEARWLKMSPTERQSAMEAVTNYVASTQKRFESKGLPYRKYPLTWLNGCCWEDEIQLPTKISVETVLSPVKSSKTRTYEPASDDKYDELARKLGQAT